jgi:hypothetical protein
MLLSYWNPAPYLEFIGPSELRRPVPRNGPPPPPPTFDSHHVGPQPQPAQPQQRQGRANTLDRTRHCGHPPAFEPPRPARLCDTSSTYWVAEPHRRRSPRFLPALVATGLPDLAATGLSALPRAKASAYARQPALAGAGPTIYHVARPGQSGDANPGDAASISLLDPTGPGTQPFMGHPPHSGDAGEYPPTRTGTAQLASASAGTQPGLAPSSQPGRSGQSTGRPDALRLPTGFPEQPPRRMLCTASSAPSLHASGEAVLPGAHESAGQPPHCLLPEGFGKHSLHLRA